MDVPPILVKPKATKTAPHPVVDGATLAAAQAGEAAAIGRLPADAVAIATERAAAAGVPPAEWVARAIRVYGKAAATAAERKRASRERAAKASQA